MGLHLPQGEGILPYWLLFNSLLSFYNSAQCFFSLYQTRALYAGPNNKTSTSSPQVTPLFARTFGCYTLVTGMLRVFAAYNIEDRNLYALATWAYVVIVVYWGMEWLWFGTVRGGVELWGSVVVDGGGLVMMVRGMWGWL